MQPIRLFSLRNINKKGKQEFFEYYARLSLMLNILKASLGIGAAKVDTVLESLSVEQGGTLKGDVVIKGGEVEQKIDAIRIELCTEIKVDIDDSISYQKHVLTRLDAVQTFTISADEIKQVPFELVLDNETPITELNAQMNQSKVWLETTLDIDFAIDPKDRDYLAVHPSSVVSQTIAAIEDAGFVMNKADVEKGFLRGQGFSSQSGCYQEIEFKNKGFLNKKEIELSFIVNGDSVHCLAEVDRSMSMRGDQYASFTLNRDAKAHEVESMVKQILSI